MLQRFSKSCFLGTASFLLKDVVAHLMPRTNRGPPLTKPSSIMINDLFLFLQTRGSIHNLAKKTNIDQRVQRTFLRSPCLKDFLEQTQERASAFPKMLTNYLNYRTNSILQRCQSQIAVVKHVLTQQYQHQRIIGESLV